MTLRTWPASLRHVQVWQMPIRQPYAGARPACSAARAVSCRRPRSPRRSRRSARGRPHRRGSRGGGGEEALAVHPLLVALPPPQRAGGLDQGGGAADVYLGLPMAGSSARSWERERCPRGRPRAFARAYVGNTHVGVPRRRALELSAIDDVALAARVVQERDGPLVALVAERAQHRGHRRDPAPPADQQQALGAWGGQHEVARRPARAQRPCRGVRARGGAGRPGPGGASGW